MAQTWRFYLIADSGEVSGTNNLEIAIVAKRDGSTLVLEPGAGEAIFDGDVRKIEETVATDWLGPDEGTDDSDNKEAAT